MRVLLAPGRWAWAGSFALVFLAACSSSPTSTPLPQAPELSAIIVTSDHSVGVNRVIFGLVDIDGMPVRLDEVPVRAAYLGPEENPDARPDAANAKFIRWPSGVQGVFSTNLEFNVPGIWEVEVDAPTPEGRVVTIRSATQVRAESSTPGIGKPAPASVTPTAALVEDLAAITTSPAPDPDLYWLSVHEALQAGMPAVVVFATPAFCLTAVCGPQVSVLSQLKEQYSGRANFIHVEVVKDPHLVQGGRPSVEFVEAVKEWGLPTEPWTFIIDKEGLVQAKFEAFATLGELADSLEQVALN